MLAICTAVNFIKLWCSTPEFKERLCRTAKRQAVSRNSSKATSLHFSCLCLLLVASCDTEHPNLFLHTLKEGCFLLKEHFNFSSLSSRCINNIGNSSSLGFSRLTHQYDEKYCLKSVRLRKIQCQTCILTSRISWVQSKLFSVIIPKLDFFSMLFLQ